MTPYQSHVAKWSVCRRCPLCADRATVVLARGSLPCSILFCGEAPGESEDVLGQPFVGPAGHLLDHIIKEAIPLEQADGPDQPPTGYLYDWAFTNLVACFPKEQKEAGINEPPDEAILACRERLVELVMIAKPRLIVAVGTLARDWLDPKAVRKNLKPLPTIPQAFIIHPAAILRAPTVQQSLMIRRSVVTLRSAIEKL